MMISIRDYTKKLSWDEIKQIMSEYKSFEENSFIGDCLLRDLTEKIMKDADSDSHVIMWMNQVANDCFRLVAEEAMKTGFVLKR